MSFVRRIKDVSLENEEPQPVYRSPLLRPLPLTAIWVGIGLLFASQEYATFRNTPSRVPLLTLMELWTIYTLISAAGFLLARRIFGVKLQTASWQYSVLRILPVSIVLCIAEEMLWVYLWPWVMKPRKEESYWHMVGTVLRADVVTVMAFFWIAVFVARGIGYYERFRANQLATSRLETELVSARLNVLQAQLNPHFLFNTMNGISSLIYVDPAAADRVLEQLSRLLRMSLDRVDMQQVALREEIDFIQSYLEIQQTRFGSKVQFEIHVAPETWDALVPTMILQPIVENAYRHGLAAANEGGEIQIHTNVQGAKLIVKVTNTGTGLQAKRPAERQSSGMGIRNVKARLQLHYKNEQSFTLRERQPGLTEASIIMPYQITDQASDGVGRLLT
ncbi:MAG TPA: histidine kinase [Acidobacteriaceae bacterium]|jgi:two-component sensor histidine kinase